MAYLEQNMRLDVVVFHDDDVCRWIAQCIQYDIAASAKNLKELRRSFDKQIAANLKLNKKFGRDGLDGIPPAPDHFRVAFDAGKDIDPSDWSDSASDDIDARFAKAA